MMENIHNILNNTVCHIRYNPTNSRRLHWNFYGTGIEKYADSPPPTSLESHEIAVYDIQRCVWRVMLCRYIQILDHMGWEQHAKYEITYDAILPPPSDPVMIDPDKIQHVKSKRCCVDIHDWSRDPGKYDNEHFDHEAYQAYIDQFVKNIEPIDDKSWKSCFYLPVKYYRPLKLCKMLNMDLHDFLIVPHDQQVLELARKKWLDVIIYYKNQAVQDLEQDVNTTDQISDTVLAEIEIVRKLLENVPEEAEKTLNSCDTINDVFATWPPLLLPSPTIAGWSQELLLGIPKDKKFIVYDKHIYNQ